MKVVIDTDAGLDDAQAIMMVLAHKDVEVLAITTVVGNTEVDDVSRNVLRLLSVAERMDVSSIRVSFPFIEVIKF